MFGLLCIGSTKGRPRRLRRGAGGRGRIPSGGGNAASFNRFPGPRSCLFVSIAPGRACGCRGGGCRPRAVCLLRRNVCDARRRGSHRRLGGGRRTGLRDLGHSHEKRLRRCGGLRLRSRYGVARRNRDFVAQRRLRQVGRHYLPTSAGARQASGRSARQGQPVGMVPDGQRHLGFRGGGALSGRTSAPAPASRWSVSRKRPRLGGFPSAAGTGQSRARTIRQGTPSLPGKPWPASPGRLRSGRNSASATGTSRPRKRPSTISGPVSAMHSAEVGIRFRF